MTLKLKPIDKLSYYSIYDESEENQQYIMMFELERYSQYSLKELIDQYGDDAIIYQEDVSSCYDQNYQYRTYIKYREIETDEAKINRLERVKLNKKREAEIKEKERIQANKKRKEKEKKEYETYLKLREKFKDVKVLSISQKD